MRFDSNKITKIVVIKIKMNNNVYHFSILSIHQIDIAGRVEFQNVCKTFVDSSEFDELSGKVMNILKFICLGMYIELLEFIVRVGNENANDRLRMFCYVVERINSLRKCIVIITKDGQLINIDYVNYNEYENDLFIKCYQNMGSKEAMIEQIDNMKFELGMIGINELKEFLENGQNRIEGSILI